MPAATRSIVIQAPIAKVLEVIKDYERYPEFLPEVKAIRLFNRKGNEVDAQYRVDVIKTIQYTIRVKDEGPTKVSWTFVEGEFMRDNKGSWTLEEAGPGQTKATYAIEMAFGPLVPKSIVGALV